jgi:hypothetical protein
LRKPRIFSHRRAYNIRMGTNKEPEVIRMCDRDLEDWIFRDQTPHTSDR